MKKGIQETSRSGGIAWFLQRISAVVLFVIIIGHFVLYHFILHGDIEKTDVLKFTRFSWFSLIQFLFLVTALYHGLNGTWAVIEDYIHHKILRLILFSLVLIVGLGLLFVGTLTIIKVSSIG
jgi:succinate dehydrogenase / fumarate reductase membrane anchor subunit